MKNTFYKRFVNLSAAALACAAILAGNVSFTAPVSGKDGSRAGIVVQAGEDVPDDETGIMPLEDSDPLEIVMD